MFKDCCHPCYSKMVPIWNKIDVCFDGEDAVKCAGECFLPKTPGMINGTDGTVVYENYKLRADFYEYPEDIATKRFGLLNKEPAGIDVGTNAKMESFTENTDGNGKKIQQLLEEIHDHQLELGRVGYLLDGEETKGFNIIPHVVKYNAKQIIDWGSIRDSSGKEIITLVVLDESGSIRNEAGKWEDKEKFRICRMSEEIRNENGEIISVGGFYYNYTIEKIEELDLSVVPNEINEPMIAGTRPDFIPFTCINERAVSLNTERPTSEIICNLSLSLYRSSADYAQTLHEQGQATFVGTGTKIENPPLGAGAYIKEENPQSKFYYAGIPGESLEEQRMAQDNKHQRIQERGVVLTDGSKESGEALSIRMTAKTASLSQIAKTAAEGLLQIIKQVASWLNIDSEEFTVEPNLDFASSNEPVKDMLDLWTAYLQGAPYSPKSWHTLANKRGLTELSFEEEEEELANVENPVTVTEENTSNQDEE